ncbi:MAG: hypothetical protein ABWY05_05800 [Noviherbaspirillum sp.]
MSHSTDRSTLILPPGTAEILDDQALESIAGGITEIDATAVRLANENRRQFMEALDDQAARLDRERTLGSIASIQDLERFFR